MRHCFFFPLTELDFLDLLGISELVREYSCNIKLILLLPDHPRVRGRYEDIIPKYFDTVVPLPFFHASRKCGDVLRKRRDFLQRLEQVDFPVGSVIFACGMRDLTHFVLCRYIRAIRSRCSHLLVNAQGNVEITNKGKINFKRSIQISAFSLPFARVVNLDYGFGPKCYPKLYDMRINIENTASDNNRITIFNNLPYPALFIKPVKGWSQRSIKLNEDAIVVFWNAELKAHGRIDNEEVYWNRLRELLEKLSDLYKGSTIYLKLHPGNSDVSLVRVRKMGYIVLDKTISAEEIYLFNHGRIRAVFATASTSLITATWFGIPSYDCSELFELDQEFITNYSPYFSHAKGMRSIHGFSDLMKRIGSPGDRKKLGETKVADFKAKWFNAFNEMEKHLQPL